MRIKDMIGRRIVGVLQSYQTLNSGRLKTLDALVLDNGVRLIPQVHEGEVNYGVTLVVNKTGKKRKMIL